MINMGLLMPYFYSPVRIFPRTPPKRLADGSLHRPPIVHTTPTYADGTGHKAAEGATKACLDFSRNSEKVRENDRKSRGV